MGDDRTAAEPHSEAGSPGGSHRVGARLPSRRTGSRRRRPCNGSRLRAVATRTAPPLASRITGGGSHTHPGGAMCTAHRWAIAQEDGGRGGLPRVRGHFSTTGDLRRRRGRKSCPRTREVSRYLVGGPGWSGAGPAAVGMMSCLCLIMIRGRKSAAAALRQVGWLDDIIVHRRAPEDPHLQRVQIEALLTCNLSCSYCYSTSGPGRKERLSHGKLWTSSTKQMP